MDQDIFGLKISIYEMLTVEVLKAKHYLCCIEFCKTLIQSLSTLDKFIEFTSIHKIHHKIEWPWVLLKSLHVHYEWMIHFLLKCHLIKHVIHLFRLYDCMLWENLNSTYLSVVFLRGIRWLYDARCSCRFRPSYHRLKWSGLAIGAPLKATSL